MRIILTALKSDPELRDAWEEHCADLPGVEVYEGSILDLKVHAIVSPANSFGFMDGGIDAAYTKHFGPSVQGLLQNRISILDMGELLVGEAHGIPTGNPDIAMVISAPTMRVPMILPPTTINPYLAAKAALIYAKLRMIKSIAFPGLGTGVGRVKKSVCAKQMRKAIQEVIMEQRTFPKTFVDAQIEQQELFLDKSAHDYEIRDLQFTGGINAN